MKTSIRKIVAVAMVLLTLCCTLPMTAWAEAGGETTPTTEPTAAAPTVKLEQLRVKGSNSKIYLSTPNLSDSTNAYSFGVPDWMETATITFIGKEGIAATCSSGQSVVATGTNYSVGVELTGDKQTFTLTLKKDSITRNIELTINRRKIDCYIENIMLYNGDNEITAQGSIDGGQMTFTLPSGSLDNIKLRVKPRHEETVSIANTTKLLEGETVKDGDKVKLKLNDYSTYYPINLSTTDSFDHLEEGTNTYYVEVKAGSVTRICDVTVIVGDPNANSPTTTTTTTTTTAPVQDPMSTTGSTAPTYTSGQQTLPGSSGGSGSSLDNIPKVLWILIAIIAMVVIGSCIFMIVNMNANNRRPSGYNNYDYDYGPPARRRRNLTEYMDDEYYDDYGYDRGRGGRYNDYDGYDDYDQPPRRGRYNEYDGYDDYDNPPRRQRYDDYDNYDGFDDGYGGGY